MAEKKEERPLRPAQRQEDQPGHEGPMRPRPRAKDPNYRGRGKLQGQVALITGGDSGIGRAVSIAFAKEIDYAATKGAILAFTRSLSGALVDRGILVNAVAPGPIWTPLIPASFPPEEVATFGSDVPLGRAGEPEEVAPAHVFLMSDDGSYFTGQVLHPNGGEIVGS